MHFPYCSCGVYQKNLEKDLESSEKPLTFASAFENETKLNINDSAFERQANFERIT